MERQYSYEVEFYKVNIEESNETSIRYNVHSTPTTIFFKDGKEIEREIGLISEEKIIAMIEELK